MINLCCLQVRLLTSGKALNTLKAYSPKMDCQSELKLNRGQQSQGYLGFSNDAQWKDWGLCLVTVIQSPSCSLNAEQLPEPPVQLGTGTAVQENTEKMQENGFLEGRAAAGSSQGSPALLWREEGQEIHPPYSSIIT